jgi:hypothetical protein
MVTNKLEGLPVTYEKFLVGLKPRQRGFLPYFAKISRDIGDPLAFLSGSSEIKDDPNHATHCHRRLVFHYSKDLCMMRACAVEDMSPIDIKETKLGATEAEVNEPEVEVDAMVAPPIHVVVERKNLCDERLKALAVAAKIRTSKLSPLERLGRWIEKLLLERTPPVPRYGDYTTTFIDMIGQLLLHVNPLLDVFDDLPGTVKVL